MSTTSPCEGVTSAMAAAWVASLRNSATSPALPNWCKEELSRAAALIQELDSQREMQAYRELQARCEKAEQEARLYLAMLERAHGMSESLRESCPYRRMLAEKGEMERTGPDVVFAHELEERSKAGRSGQDR